MENHKCKLCLKSFSNGRALGGHMRSHVMNLPLKPDEEHEEEHEDDDEEEAVNELSEETESVSSYSSDDDDDDEDDDEEKCRLYGLEENPKTDYRSVVVDHESSLFHVHDGDHSVVLQDRESETESSRNMTRRRSKRISRKLRLEESVETEPVSSVSDTTTEEDIAFCLMMLSRDKWNNNDGDDDEDDGENDEKDGERKHKLKRDRIEEEEEDGDHDDDETDESEEFIKLCNKNRVKLYRCDTCKRAFKSYQALGGHRASHKKMKSSQVSSYRKNERDQESVVSTVATVVEKKLHECPLCFRIFSSGQALGGHKRSHGTQLLETTTTTTTSVVGESSIKVRESLIDLNLPAPMDDDDFSQIELSAVSYSEYMNHFTR